MKRFSRILGLVLVLALTLMAAASAEVPTEDRAGNAIALPDEINKVVSLAPAITQMMESFDSMDTLVAVDSYSPLYVDGLSDLPQFDMMTPDVEQIAALEPDVVFTTGMSYIENNPFTALVDMGICVIDIPSSTSIADVEKDILFVAACLGKDAEGQTVVDEMAQKIEAIASIGETISQKKNVLFEISALPSIYSFGSGTFLDEMLSLIGAENVFGELEGWVSVNEEDAIASNPDVILTNVDYLEDPVAEILARPGWNAVTAVANQEVHYIDNVASSLPNQYIADALVEMALAVYPDAYAEFAK